MSLVVYSVPMTSTTYYSQDCAFEPGSFVGMEGEMYISRIGKRLRSFWLPVSSLQVNLWLVTSSWWPPPTVCKNKSKLKVEIQPLVHFNKLIVESWLEKLCLVTQSSVCILFYCSFVSPFVEHSSVLEIIFQMLHFRKTFIKQLMMDSELLWIVFVKWIFCVENSVCFR